jgi:Ca-activated chloride channel family protein
VILVVDVSGSMRATDVKPSRLAAAQGAMRTFAGRVPAQVQVGIVAFSDDAQVVVTPTRDRDRLLAGVANLEPGFGTAIGDALDRAVTLARTATARDKTGGRPQSLRDEQGRSLATILLLSDGSQTRGVLTPGQGADLAKRAGVPVNTVALGTDAGSIIVGLGSQRQLVPVPPDRTTLSAIAEYTGGEAFDAETAETLDGVYRKLGSQVGRERVQRQVSSVLVALGALLAAGAVGAGMLVAPRLP